jgi:peroxiredoxin
MTEVEHVTFPSMYEHFDLPRGMKESTTRAQGLSAEVRSNAMSPGINLVRQGPVLSATWAGNPRELSHSGPSPVTARTFELAVGDTLPEFDLPCTDGSRASRASLAGRPTILLLARVLRPGNACSRSLVGLDDLRRTTYATCVERGIRLVVVVPTTVNEARHLVQAWALPFPLYADPECGLFDAFDCGYLGPPLHGWIVLDADTVIRYVFRTIQTLELPLPMPSISDLIATAGATRG